jgi:hypothetical protein
MHLIHSSSFNVAALTAGAVWWRAHPTDQSCHTNVFGTASLTILTIRVASTAVCVATSRRRCGSIATFRASLITRCGIARLIRSCAIVAAPITWPDGRTWDTSHSIFSASRSSESQDDAVDASVATAQLALMRQWRGVMVGLRGWRSVIMWRKGAARCACACREASKRSPEPHVGLRRRPRRPTWQGLTQLRHWTFVVRHRAERQPIVRRSAAGVGIRRRVVSTRTSTPARGQHLDD